MTITKKDTIVLAVLFNIVILAGVLATAHQLSSKAESPIRERGTSPVLSSADDKDLADRYVPQEEAAQSFDEIDQLLEEYISEEEPQVPPIKTAANDAKKKPSKCETKDAKTKDLSSSDEYYITFPSKGCCNSITLMRSRLAT
jgi:hypothetical protein